MGLTKRAPPEEQPGGRELRFRERDEPGLLAQLTDPDATGRRWAALDLADHPDAWPALLEQLRVEPERFVQTALLSSLIKHPDMGVVRGLMRLLRCEDAWLRNAVIEALSLLPGEVALVIEELLRDEDSDVRILTANLLTTLPHPSVPGWLFRLATEDEHPNVVASALEGLCECGTPEMRPELERLKVRFRALPFVVFSAELVIDRLGQPK
jgi:HEAT repeat protein